MIMKSKATIAAILLIATVAILAPEASALGSAAQPMAHPYVGVSLTNAIVNVDESTPLGDVVASASSSTTIVGVCLDLSPIVQTFPLPPQLDRDGVAETGVGGGCFAFHTIYGDDT